MTSHFAMSGSIIVVGIHVDEKLPPFLAKKRNTSVNLPLVKNEQSAPIPIPKSDYKNYYCKPYMS